MMDALISNPLLGRRRLRYSEDPGLRSTSDAGVIVAENHIDRFIWIVLCITIVVLAITSRIGLIAWPFLNDSGLFAALGRTVATGGVMYRDFYETKLPGAGIVAAGFWRAFGDRWPGYVLCQLAMTFIAAGFLARAAGRHAARSAALPTFLFAVVFLNFNYAVYTGFQLETIQAFFESLAAAAALEAIGNDDTFAAFAAGLAAGCAAMAKPGGVGIAIVLIFFSLRRPRKIIAVICGMAIPTWATYYYTVKSGAWAYLPDVVRDINRYVEGTPMHADAVLKIGVVLAVLGWPFVWRGFRSWRVSPVLFFASAWFVVDLAAAVAQRRLYPYHFLPLACPAALLYGMLPTVRPMRVAMGLLPIAALSLTWEGSSLANLHRGFEHTSAIDYVIALTDVSDSVFSDQNGRLLIQSGRQPGSRLGTFFYFVNDDSAPQDYCRVLLADFETRRPKYLVLAEGWDRAVPRLSDCDILSHCSSRRANFLVAWGTLREYVHGHYVKEATVEGQGMYRRVDSKPSRF